MHLAGNVLGEAWAQTSAVVAAPSLEHQLLLSSPIWLSPLFALDLLATSAARAAPCTCSADILTPLTGSSSPPVWVLAPCHQYSPLPWCLPVTISIKASLLKGQERLSLTLNNWGLRAPTHPAVENPPVTLQSALCICNSASGDSATADGVMYGTQLLKTI